MAERNIKYYDTELGEWVDFSASDTLPSTAIPPGSGTGDVVGPASSVDDRIVTFNGVTGKLIQDSGVLLSAKQDTLVSATNIKTINGASVLGAGDLAVSSEAFPIGSVFIAVVSTNPATLLGYGSWEAFGAGRVLVGLDSGQTEFDTVEETGGAKTHTLTTGEMPVHTHTQNAHSHLLNGFPTATGGSTGFTRDTSMSGTQAATALTTTDTTAVNQDTGGGGAHNNLQPYIVVYMWKRITP